MTKEEFEQLRAEQEAEERPAAVGGGSGGSTSGGGGGSSGEQKQPQRLRLSLGRDLLQGDFGEMVGSTILQVRADK
jgi:hypothetical protein